MGHVVMVDARCNVNRHQFRDDEGDGDGVGQKKRSSTWVRNKRSHVILGLK